MSGANGNRELQFACECVSAKGGYSDPWAAISQNKLLPDGTKEEILNRLAKEPRTIAQLAKELELSQPSIHRHIGEMMASELLHRRLDGRAFFFGDDEQGINDAANGQGEPKGDGVFGNCVVFHVVKFVLPVTRLSRPWR